MSGRPEQDTPPDPDGRPVDAGSAADSRAPVVVSTRPQPSAAFSRILDEAGIAVRHLPLTIIAEPADWQPADSAIDALRSYDGVLLTSANAVEKFFGRVLERTGVLTHLPPLHAVGQRTADKVEAFGLQCASVMNRGGAKQLAVRLQMAAGNRFLQPCSDLARTDAREVLEQRGAVTEMVTVYRTVPATADSTQQLRALLAMKETRCVAFFAPSGVKEYERRIAGFDSGTASGHPADADGSLLYAAIGETTAEALRAAGLRADIVAQTQTAEHLAMDIASSLRSQHEHG